MSSGNGSGLPSSETGIGVPKIGAAEEAAKVAQQLTEQQKGEAQASETNEVIKDLNATKNPPVAGRKDPAQALVDVIDTGKPLPPEEELHIHPDTNAKPPRIGLEAVPSAQTVDLIKESAQTETSISSANGEPPSPPKNTSVAGPAQPEDEKEGSQEAAAGVASKTGQGQSMTPPVAPANQEATQATDAKVIRDKIDDVRKDPARAQRKATYDNAQNTIASLTAKPEGQRTDAEKAQLLQAQSAASKIEKDAGLEVQVDKIAAMDSGADKTKARDELLQKDRDVYVQDALDANTAYQQAQQKLAKENERWKNMGATEISALSGSDRKAYEEYLALNHQAEVTKQEAEFAAREAQLKGYVGQKLLSPAERSVLQQQLEVDRRKAQQDDVLRKDKGYQKSLRETSGIEQKIAGLNGRDGKPYGQDFVNDLTSMDWDQVPENVQKEAFDNNPKLFNDYKANKEDMESRKIAAGRNVDSSRPDVKSDGTAYSKDPKVRMQERKQEAIESQAKWTSDKQPNLVKKRFRGIAKWINKQIGKAEMQGHAKAASGWAERLFSKYGILGIPGLSGFLKEGDREQAKIYRGLLGKELFAYARIAGLRGLRNIFFLSLLFWAAYPLILGKVLEVTKPFGGNS